MTDINSVVLVGRVTADIESSQNGFSYSSSGTAIAKISIAVNRSRKQGDKWVDEASFFNITIWGKTAENLKPYLKKGQLVAVKGFLKQDRWKDQQGNNRSAVSVTAEQVELCGRNGEGESLGESAQNYSAPQQMAQNEGFQEDIPF